MPSRPVTLYLIISILFMLTNIGKYLLHTKNDLDQIIPVLVGNILKLEKSKNLKNRPFLSGHLTMWANGQALEIL